jgi:exodeoxyribonuclease-5
MLTLNADQEAASAAFTAFMVSPETELVISGAAGVGKTTLLKHLMQLQDPSLMCSLLGKKPITEWALTATTNKAAEVLQEATGITATTIHSFLGLTVMNDFETGRSKITRKGNAEVKENTLIVVDECSMVDSELRRYIGLCTLNCKIVYVGDHCQMAPVMETVSPVFADNQPVLLNTVIRSQHTPAITALCTQLRATVETGFFNTIAANDPAIEYLDPAAAEAEIQKVFVHDDKPDARIRLWAVGDGLPGQDLRAADLPGSHHCRHLPCALRHGRVPRPGEAIRQAQGLADVFFPQGKHRRPAAT